jgi:hypothetical protein
MNTKPYPTEPEHMDMEDFLRELPPHGSHTAEEDEYVQHYCGLECYELWRKREIDPL